MTVLSGSTLNGSCKKGSPMNECDHAKAASDLLTEGREVVGQITGRHKVGDREGADDYGKQAIGIWAQAQAHATLALAAEQRTANLIAVAFGDANIFAELGDASPFKPVFEQIREGLNL
jgi:hypothetical protein